LLHISTNEQLADLLTKPLPPPKFTAFISKLGMINIYHAPACGRILKQDIKELESSLLANKEEEHARAQLLEPQVISNPKCKISCN